MGNILVYLQQAHGKLMKASLCATTAAKELKVAWKKEKMSALLLGTGAAAVADEALALGFDEVLFSENPAFEKYLAIPYAQACLSALNETAADTFVCAATSTGKDFAPRIASALDGGQASDIVAVNSDGSLKRPMYAGDVIADVKILSEKKIVTVRATGFAPAVSEGAKGQKRELQLTLDLAKAGEVVSYDLSVGGRPELSDAEIVVSGGRAMQSSENFEKYILPLADAFGAAVGASRAAVDSGYAPNDWQVGQTGKIVAPGLYVAVGISGAIQHLAGMKDSKVVVAINKDADAPIFEVADYGLVADLFQAVPEFTAAVKKAKGS